MWYGWLEVMETNGHCGLQDDGSKDSYGIWMHLPLGILFYITLTVLFELWFLPARIFEHCYEKKKGFTNANGCTFTIT